MATTPVIAEKAKDTKKKKRDIKLDS